MAQGGAALGEKPLGVGLRRQQVLDPRAQRGIPGAGPVEERAALGGAGQSPRAVKHHLFAFGSGFHRAGGRRRPVVLAHRGFMSGRG